MSSMAPTFDANGSTMKQKFPSFPTLASFSKTHYKTHPPQKITITHQNKQSKQALESKSSTHNNMSTLKIRSKKPDDIRGLVTLRLLIRKLVQKGLSILSARGLHHHNDFDEATVVPEDVKEGHFAVFAVKGKEAERFVVKLESLQNPEFLRLLEEAEEEYGFEQKGALAVPCRPEELHKILEKRREKNSSNNNNINLRVIQGC